MINTLIVEDEKKSRDLLSTMVRDYTEGFTLVGQAASVEEGTLLIKELNPQLILMDIQLQGRTAFELLDAFPNRDFEVIFTTAYEQYALQAIKYSGIDYLLKPIGLNELREALQKAFEKIEAKPAPSSKPDDETGKSAGSSNTPERLVVPTHNGLMMLESSQIMYLEAAGAYTNIHLYDKAKILVCNPIGVYESRLVPDSPFVRIHRSRLVNLTYIQEYVRGRGGYVLLKNGDQLSVSARRKAALLEAIGI